MHEEPLIQLIRKRGQYSTDEAARRSLHVVLTAFGAQLRTKTRQQLADRLPESCRSMATEPPAAPEPLPPQRLVAAVADAAPTPSLELARWDISAVLSAIADTIDQALLKEILSQLPPGYPLLFRRTTMG